MLDRISSTAASGRTRRLRIAALTLLAVAVLDGCKQHSHNAVAATAAPAAAAAAAAAVPKPLSVMAQLGRKLFFEPSLSSSGKMACASCHSPEHAFGPPNDLSVQLGGPDLKVQGARAVPNLTYQGETPNFSIGPDLDAASTEQRSAADTQAPRQKLIAQAPPSVAAQLATQAPGAPKASSAANTAANLVPRGGFFWDGRADTLQGQALGPLLNPLEMDNKDAQMVVDKLRKLSYVDDFKALFGPRILDDSGLLLSEALFALARYESEERAFHAYDSKYDQYLRNQVGLSDAEMRGLKLFDDPKKGNCASCHLDKKTADGHFPTFTDYQFEALGVPRNGDIKANADPHYYDLSICGPTRNDSYSKQPQNCGLFKTPSLRNVATRHAFFHNGEFHSLEDVLHFYVERDTNPDKFYPRLADGSIDKFDDLPPKYRGNVDVIDAPFDRKPGDAPALNEAEIQDIIAFLGTLTDGYQPGAGAGGTP